jgi:hypothetical protein
LRELRHKVFDFENGGANLGESESPWEINLVQIITAWLLEQHGKVRRLRAWNPSILLGSIQD